MLRTLVEHAALFLVWFLLIGFLMFTFLGMGSVSSGGISY
jgi:hypothetical protein